MTYLLLQTFLLLLASYFLGAFLACLVKRTVLGSRRAAPAHIPVPVRVESPIRPPAAVVAPVRPRVAVPVAPRPIDPVQPKIDVLRRPAPRPAPKVMDPSRFERALMGPDPNEGFPRKAVVEIRPAVLKSPTGPVRPRAPAPPPAAKPAPVSTAPPVAPKIEAQTRPAPEPVRATGPSDATTSAAAAAVAAAKAAAAASTASAGAVRAPEAKADLPPRAPVVPPAPSRAVEPSSPELPPPTPAKIEPKSVAKPAPVVNVPIEGGDDFQRIRAIDADLEHRLKAAGVNYFEDIAAWTGADIKRIGQELDMPGRIEREQWVEQAQILAKGGETYYSRNRLAAQKSTASPSPSPPAAPKPTSVSAASAPSASPAVTAVAATPAAPSLAPSTSTSLSGVAAASQGRSVAEMAAAAAAAIAAASASVTRGLKPIEPISPLSRVNPNIAIPARLSDAIKGKEAAAARSDNKAPPSAAPAKTAAGEGPGNDLKRIRGIGVLIEKRLNAMGITRYEQIANWTSGDIDRVSQVLEFKGRIEREGWVEQARILSSGGQTEFSRRVDRGEVDTSRET